MWLELLFSLTFLVKSSSLNDLIFPFSEKLKINPSSPHSRNSHRHAYSPVIPDIAQQIQMQGEQHHDHRRRCHSRHRDSSGCLFTHGRQKRRLMLASCLLIQAAQPHLPLHISQAYLCLPLLC